MVVVPSLEVQDVSGLSFVFLRFDQVSRVGRSILVALKMEGRVEELADGPSLPQLQISLLLGQRPLQDEARRDR